MEIDTGAARSIISKATFERIWIPGNAPALKETASRLKTYTGELIKVCGEIEVDVRLERRHALLSLIVVEGNGPSLLGRDWMEILGLSCCQLNQIQQLNELECVLAHHAKVFKDELGFVKGTQARIYIESGTSPRYFRARSLPFALRGKVEQELTRLQEQGVIEPVQLSDWAAPVVPVVKSDGTIRLCGDYKVTINQASKIDKYPLPQIDDLLSSLAGGQSFSKLDLAHAYLQIPLHEDSKKLTTINTHKGLFQYTRLPFGIASAPSIFQRTIESILQGIPKVCVYIDDILVPGRTEDEHLKNLREVLERLETSGFRLKPAKCLFFSNQSTILDTRFLQMDLVPTKRRFKR